MKHLACLINKRYTETKIVGQNSIQKLRKLRRSLNFLQGFLKDERILEKQFEGFLCPSDFSLEVKKLKPMLYRQLRCISLDT